MYLIFTKSSLKYWKFQINFSFKIYKIEFFQRKKKVNKFEYRK